MKSESARYVELLERRLTLLVSLIQKAKEWRKAFIGFDLQNAEQRIAEEEQLCRTIQALDAEIATLQARRAERAGLAPRTGQLGWPRESETTAGLHERERATLSRIAAAQNELRRLNDINQAILRRSRQTVNALRNLFISYAPTYASPASPGAGMVYQERI
jgi:erythromycin esterase-like protein